MGVPVLGFRMPLALASDRTELAWPLRLVTGRDAVRVRIRALLQTVAGSRPEDTRQGVPEAWLVGGPQPTASEAAAYLRSQLRRVVGVEEVRSLTVTVGAGGAWSVSGVVVVQTVDGLADLTIGEPLPYDTRGAPAWYLASGQIADGVGPSWTGA